MWDSIIDHGNLNEVFLSVFNPFADGIGNFSCLAQTFADMTILVTDNYKSCKSKITSALNGLGYTTNMNNFLFEFECIWIYRMKLPP
jgi:hypothetical protein